MTTSVSLQSYFCCCSSERPKAINEKSKQSNWAKIAFKVASLSTVFAIAAYLTAYKTTFVVAVSGIIGAAVLIKKCVFSSGNRLYFAYGSNMSQKRLEDRVGKVNHCGIGTLKNYQFLYNKRGSNGTGKANIIPERNSEVKGVLF